MNFVKSLAHPELKRHFIDKLHFQSKIQTSSELKRSEVQSSLQLPHPASTNSFSCPISSAHIHLQQLPEPQVILNLHVSITIRQMLLRSRQLRYVFR